MTIIYYDIAMPRHDLRRLTDKIRQQFTDEVIFLPKSFDVLLEASSEQLMSAKRTIEAALAMKDYK